MIVIENLNNNNEEKDIENFYNYKIESFKNFYIKENKILKSTINNNSDSQQTELIIKKIKFLYDVLNFYIYKKIQKNNPKKDYILIKDIININKRLTNNNEKDNEIGEKY